MLEDASSQVIYRGDRHAVLRAGRPDGSTVIVKTPVQTGPAAEPTRLRLFREYELLKTLELPGVGRALAMEERGGQPALVLRDAGPFDLSRWQRRRPLPLGLFFELALQLAETLGSLHAQGVVHRDVSPSNVIVSPDGRLTLVDFDAATRLPVGDRGGLAPRREGSLRYLPPEETGRLDRMVDHRADLYGLGATLYEMLTGTPPFSALDPVDLVHAHLARSPVSPERLNPLVPAALSSIVLRLLAKMPEARYEGVDQLSRDIRAVRVSTGTGPSDSGWPWLGPPGSEVPALSSGEEPAPIGSAVHGRDSELARLKAAWQTILAGGHAIIEIVGEAGIGKSTLARQLIPVLGESGGRFVHTKFSMRPGQGPHAALLSSLREILRDVQRSAPDAPSALQRIVLDLGDDLGALLQVMPELRPLFHAVRVTPPRADRGLGPAVLALVRALATSHHPLCICLDDLQWAGPESWPVIEGLISAAIPHLLLICTRRLDSPRPAGLERDGVERLTLGPLAVAEVTALTADLLSCDKQRAGELGELLQRKTGGNPFLCRKLIGSLQSSRMLEYDTQDHAWTWDLAAIAGLDVSEGVADIMVRSLGLLPERTRQALALVACVGHQAPLDTLAATRREPSDDTTAALEPAVREGHLLQLWRSDGSHGARPVYQFAHDRVLEAAYSLLSEDERRRQHRLLGRQLLLETNLDAPGQGQAIFAVVDQLNLGPCPDDERLELALLNRRAAVRARADFAAAAELGYLRRALELLPPDSWQSHRSLTVSLHREALESALLNDDQALAEQLFAAASAHASSRLERAALHERRVAAARTREDYRGEAEASGAGLELFDIHLPEEPGAALAELIADNERCLAGRSIEALMAAPRMTDPEHQCCVRLLARQQISLYLIRDPRTAPVLARIVNMCLRHGMVAQACQAFASYGLLLLKRVGDVQLAHRWGRIGVALSTTFDDPVEEARAVAIFNTAVAGWTQPLDQLLPGLQRVISLSMEHGDPVYGVGAALTTVSFLYHLGRPLPEVMQELEVTLALTRKTRMHTTEETVLVFRQVIRRLQNHPEGESTGPQDSDGLAGSHVVARLTGAYLLGELEEARRLATRGEQLVTAFTRSVQPVEVSYYGALTLARLCQREPAESPPRQEMLEKIQRHHQELDRWAAQGPENYRHKQLLVAAELASLSGRPLEAVELYDQALEAAGRAGFLQDESLAAELAARFHLAAGRKRFARRYLEAAVQGYARWGAEAKVRTLESELFHLRGDEHWPSLAGSALSSSSSGADGVDLMSLARASEAIAREIVPEQLSARLMGVCLAMGGAERGALLIADSGALSLWASAAVGSAPDVSRRPLDDSAELPVELIDRVRRSGEPMVFGDVTQEPQLSGDPALLARGVRSLLVLPVLHQGRVGGVLYLEHTRATRAFAHDRVKLLQLLSGQIAIALENSQLFERLAGEVQERRRAEASVRFLADAGAVLSESLDYQATLDKLAQLVVPTLADWCLVDLLDERGQMRRMAAAHRDPQVTERLDELRTDGRHWASPALFHEVMTSGKAVLVPEVTSAVLEHYVSDPKLRDLIRDIGAKSGITVPLMAHGRCLGAVTLCSSRADRSYDETDLVVAEELARRAAIAIENARLYAEARQAIRLREEFLAVASHELNTPITSLRLISESLQGDLFRDAPHELERAVAIISRQSRRLSVLVHDLLDVAQLQAGRLPLQLSQGDLASMVRQVTESLQPELDRHGCTLQVRSPGPVPGRWDRGRIERIVTNLLSNAMKFGAGKPIGVTTESANEGRVRLVVEDQGIGIPADRLPYIFDRFERAVPTTHYGGLGLGLYIVREAARSLGGTVRADSVLGEGSRFTVELPVLTSP